jgi:hypothetical protein
METSTTEQPTPMQAEPQKEHQWLQKFVGEWTFESESPAEPGAPAQKNTGTETVRSLGGLWIVGEGRGQMPDGTPATMVLTLGYDPQKQRYVGTWFGSMMTYLWVYEGEVDAAGRVLTLNTEGPNMETGAMARYKDVYEFKSDDHRVLTSHMQGEDGNWQQFMSMEYRRKK